MTATLSTSAAAVTQRHGGSPPIARCGRDGSRAAGVAAGTRRCGRVGTGSGGSSDGVACRARSSRRDDLGGEGGGQVGRQRGVQLVDRDGGELTAIESLSGDLRDQAPGGLVVGRSIDRGGGVDRVPAVDRLAVLLDPSLSADDLLGLAAQRVEILGLVVLDQPLDRERRSGHVLRGVVPAPRHVRPEIRRVFRRRVMSGVASPAMAGHDSGTGRSGSSRHGRANGSTRLRTSTAAASTASKSS